MVQNTTKVYAGQRAVALWIVTLLLAMNDFGYTTPNTTQSLSQQVLCIDAAAGDSPLIQFSKGTVQHFRSVDGYEFNSDPWQPANGDTIQTGADGFVSILLAHGQVENVQPRSSIRFDSSKTCQNDNFSDDKNVQLETPYLSAAIRG